MKKFLTILSILILALMNACSGSSGSDNNGGGGGGGSGAFPLIEVKNPPVIDRAKGENIERVINNETIIKYDRVNNAYYLLTYDGEQWAEEKMADGYVYMTYLDAKSFLITDESYISTLFTYENDSWGKHNVLRDEEIYDMDRNNMLIEDTGSELNVWIFKNNQWEKLLTGIDDTPTFWIDDTFISFEKNNEYSLWQYIDDQLVMVIDFQPEDISVINEFLLYVGATVWIYENGAWREAPEFLDILLTGQEGTILAIASADQLTSLYEYKNGQWQKHDILADKTFLIKTNDGIYDGQTDDYWIYKDDSWQTYEELSNFKNNNPDKYYYQHINKNTVLVEDLEQPDSGEFQLYDSSLTTRYNANEVYSNSYMSFYFINSNTIILYSENDNMHHLLEYDSNANQWNKVTAIDNGIDAFDVLNENAFIGEKNMWVYENGSWKTFFPDGYNVYILNSVSVIARDDNNPIAAMFYAYDGNKWNKIYEAGYVYRINDNAVITIEDEGLLKIWYFDGKKWELSHTFENASHYENYIQTADGKLYYFDN